MCLFACVHVRAHVYVHAYPHVHVDDLLLHRLAILGGGDGDESSGRVHAQQRTKVGDDHEDDVLVYLRKRGQWESVPK